MWKCREAEHENSTQSVDISTVESYMPVITAHQQQQQQQQQ